MDFDMKKYLLSISIVLLGGCTDPLPIGQYIFWGTLGFILVSTIVLNEGPSFFFGNTLWFTYRIIVIFVWWGILFESGHTLMSRVVVGLFFAYPLYGITKNIFEEGLFIRGSDKSSGAYHDIEDQGAADVDDF